MQMMVLSHVFRFNCKLPCNVSSRVHDPSCLQQVLRLEFQLSEAVEVSAQLEAEKGAALATAEHAAEEAEAAKREAAHQVCFWGLIIGTRFT